MSTSIPKSSYLPFFQSHGARVAELMKVTGDILLVEKMTFPEAKTASGIILESGKHNHSFNGLAADKPGFYRVLHVGEGFYDDTTNEDVSLDSKPGAIVLLGAVSVKLFSMLPLQESYVPDTIGIARETDVQISFKEESHFHEFLQSFNSAVKEQMAASK